MEDEEIVESKPTETMESDEDFFADVDNEVITENIDKADEVHSETEETNEAEEPSEADEVNKETEEVDFKPLLDALKGKIKYNKEEVNVESIDDLISNYQKGLNYDKKLQELENLQNSKLEKYAKAKAEEMGITVDEYMDQVEAYEKEQERAKERDRIEEMINNGVPEETAKEVIAAGQMRKKYQQMENELKKREEALNKEEAKKKEYQDFLEQFPDVNPDEIPKEVFEEAEKSSLSNAYMKWKLNELQKELNVAKTNEKNAKASVGGVTKTGPTNEKHETDPFLEGFLE
jgi:hypothetical protein